MERHRCYATGCEKQIATRMLMCAPHWFMVPKPLRDQVWAEYRAGTARREYVTAISAARAAVAAREEDG